MFVSELGRPTSVDLVSSNPDHMVVSFTSGNLVLFNMETQKLLLKMEASGWPGERREEEGRRRVELRRGGGEDGGRGEEGGEGGGRGEEERRETY